MEGQKAMSKRIFFGDADRGTAIEIGLIYFMHLMGVFWYLTGYLGDTIHYLSGPFIIILGLYAVYCFIRGREDKNKRSGYILLIGMLGFGLETIGWHTGFPYGQFYYTDTLKPQILGTPVAISFAWITLSICSASVISYLEKSSIYIKALSAGIFVFILDFIMEPAAVKLNYWYWEGSTIPIENYVTWLITGAVFSFLLLKNFDIENKSVLQRNIFLHIYLAQIIYFLLIDLYY
jgi:putative membrane protein